MFTSIYRQNFNRVEIEICTQCNLRCYQCDRSSAQAPSAEYMTIAQISHFVKESIALRWLWYEIEVLGGEPTLHPDLLEILNVLYGYIEFNPDCQIIVVSNGYGKKVQETLNQVPSWVTIENTSKQEVNQIPFNDYNIAPIDLEQYINDEYSRGCKIVSECGLGLNRYGYYPCGAGASVDRVFGFDIGIKRLSSVKDKILFDQRKVICRYCGHYKAMRCKIRTFNEMSPAWVEAYKIFRINKPILKLYGAS